MPYVDTIPPDRAQGRLRALYDAAIQRAGKVFQILQVQSLSFDSLQAAPKMVTAPHSPVPFSPTLEDLYVPSAARIEEAVREVAGGVKAAT